MLPTVGEVLATPELAAGEPQVLAGGAALDRPVRWVHAAELADIGHLLRGGELVMTTGIALPEVPEGLTRYVQGLVEAQVAGLVVELGRRWLELPTELVMAAEQTGLPLISLRREVRFATVAQTVGERIVDSQMVELRASARIHEAFTELSVSGADNARILAEVVRMAGRPVVLESLSSRVLEYDAAGMDADMVLDRWEDRSSRLRSAERTTYFEAEGWLVTRVGARGDDWGRLVLVCETTPTEREVVLVERAAVALALRRLLAREHESLERQSHRELLDAVLAGDSTADTAAAVAQRCAATGLPVTGRALVGLAVVPVEQPPETTPVRRTRVARDLAESVAAAARSARLPALVGSVEDSAVRALLAIPPAADVDAAVNRLARRIHEAAASLPEEQRVVVAAGSTVGSVREAARSLREARQVVEAGGSRTDNPACLRLADLHVRGLVHLLAGDERLAAFAERHLGPLRAYDAEHGTRLLPALRSLVEHGGNKVAAASAAHLSRAAYYARLASVEAVLGLDLSDPEVLTSLHVAILAVGAAEGSPSPG